MYACMYKPGSLPVPAAMVALRVDSLSIYANAMRLQSDRAEQEAAGSDVRYGTFAWGISARWRTNRDIHTCSWSKCRSELTRRTLPAMSSRNVAIYPYEGRPLRS